MELLLFILVEILIIIGVFWLVIYFSSVLNMAGEFKKKNKPITSKIFRVALRDINGFLSRPVDAILKRKWTTVQIPYHKDAFEWLNDEIGLFNYNFSKKKNLTDDSYEEWMEEFATGNIPDWEPVYYMSYDFRRKKDAVHFKMVWG